jgi:RND family efflux transporter MFP subunit
MMRHTLLLLPALAVAAAGCDRGEPGRLESSGSPQDVTVSAVVSSLGATQVAGRVLAAQSAELATRTSGTVMAVLVEVGAPVRAGQTLVRLDDAGVESSVSGAEAAVTVARKSHARLENLLRDGAATAQELDQATAQLEMAEARLREARSQREYVTLRAPFDGTVAARMVDPGDLAVPGMAVLSLAGSGAVKVEADAPAALAGRVATGDELMVVAPAGGSWPAVVSRKVPVIDRTSNRFRLEARFAPGRRDLPLPGTYVRLELPGTEGASLLVPDDALVRQGQLTGVYALEGGVLRLRWIRPGRARDGAVEVLAGLGPDAVVVRSPAAALRDGIAAGTVRREEWSPEPAGGEGR